MNDLRLQFSDPPEPGTRPRTWSYDWIAIAGQLRQHPGRWMYLDSDSETGEPRLVKRSIVNAIRLGSIKQFRPSMGFEIKTEGRDSATDSMFVHVRYNPEKDQKKESE